MLRKLFLIVILLGLAGGAVWYFVIQKNTQDGVTPQTPRSFFPLGGTRENREEETIEPPIPIEGGGTTTISNSPFKRLTNNPVAGYAFFTTTRTVTTPNANPRLKPTVETFTDRIVRYVSRQSGFVYEIKNGTVALQITNLFIPNIYEVVFADAYNTVLLRFLRDDTQTIATYAVPIPPENTDGSRTQKEGIFLPDGLTGVTASPDLKEIAQLAPITTGSTLTTSTSQNKNRKEVMLSALKEWIIMWPQAKTLYVQTKAAGTVRGFLYKIDRTERRLRRVVGDVPGLTTSVSPSGTYVLYSESSTTSFTTKLLNTKSGAVQNLGLSILPEKCTWLSNEDLICAGGTPPEGTYPDVWYAGLISFSDQLYRIYTASGLYDVLYDNTEFSFDMINLQVDEVSSILYFIDKRTGVLWQFSF
jgi:hypothetical protein